MKILVFDDNAINRAAAVAQLAGHELTVVGTYDEAQKLLAPMKDGFKAQDILKSRYPDLDDYDSFDEVKKAECDSAWRAAHKEAMTYPSFDVVLSDLLVPASGQQQGSDGIGFVGKEMSVGIFIALLAATGAAKYVAVFTDSDHHSHPASACFDAFNWSEGEPTPFTVNGAKVLLCNNRNWVGKYDPNDLATKLEYNQYKERTDTVRAKNWAALLDYLVK